MTQIHAGYWIRRIYIFPHKTIFTHIFLLFIFFTFIHFACVRIDNIHTHKRWTKFRIYFEWSEFYDNYILAIVHLILHILTCNFTSVFDGNVSRFAHTYTIRASVVRHIVKGNGIAPWYIWRIFEQFNKWTNGKHGFSSQRFVAFFTQRVKSRNWELFSWTDLTYAQSVDLLRQSNCLRCYELVVGVCVCSARQKPLEIHLKARWMCWL